MPRKYVTNQSDLARELGCSQIALKKWLHDDRYAARRPSKTDNYRYVVAEFRKWAGYHKLKGRAKSKKAEQEMSGEQRLKQQMLEVKLAQEKAKLAKVEGESVDRHLVADVFGAAMAYLYREIDRVFGDEIPPRTRGLTEKQQAKLNRDEIKSIFKEAKRVFEKRFEEGMERNGT